MMIRWKRSRWRRGIRWSRRSGRMTRRNKTRRGAQPERWGEGRKEEAERVSERQSVCTFLPAHVSMHLHCHWHGMGPPYLPCRAHADPQQATDMCAPKMARTMMMMRSVCTKSLHTMERMLSRSNTVAIHSSSSSRVLPGIVGACLGSLADLVD
ncbi:hypothetical protein BZA05DRAFT_51806 [Tricharina praecox]|uniref:uncharacterized protein n=1 Tax=Tricharina praecox TaxID=43433 RepID=UPI00222011E2|nr:uncharacterized protein BZA05DRAFT_51806 [Tricharina praecox]KAI5850872.1 hypothetical protein BZA05DRAFT_51806 [Tricharina praecox]